MNFFFIYIGIIFKAYVRLIFKVVTTMELLDHIILYTLLRHWDPANWYLHGVTNLLCLYILSRYSKYFNFIFMEAGNLLNKLLLFVYHLVRDFLQIIYNFFFFGDQIIYEFFVIMSYAWALIIEVTVLYGFLIGGLYLGECSTPVKYLFAFSFAAFIEYLSEKKKF